MLIHSLIGQFQGGLPTLDVLRHAGPAQAGVDGGKPLRPRPGDGAFQPLTDDPLQNPGVGGRVFE